MDTLARHRELSYVWSPSEKCMKENVNYSYTWGVKTSPRNTWPRAHKPRHVKSASRPQNEESIRRPYPHRGLGLFVRLVDSLLPILVLRKDMRVSKAPIQWSINLSKCLVHHSGVIMDSLLLYISPALSGRYWKTILVYFVFYKLWQYTYGNQTSWSQGNMLFCFVSILFYLLFLWKISLSIL